MALTKKVRERYALIGDKLLDLVLVKRLSINMDDATSDTLTEELKRYSCGAAHVFFLQKILYPNIQFELNNWSLLNDSSKSTYFGACIGMLLESQSDIEVENGIISRYFEFTKDRLKTLIIKRSSRRPSARLRTSIRTSIATYDEN